MCRARLHNHPEPIQLKTLFLNGLLADPGVAGRGIFCCGNRPRHAASCPSNDPI
jgi:hypothetical protein